MPHPPILGIDLGTSNSCVSVMTEMGPIVIPNRGHTTTPSIIAIAPDGTTSVGHAAKKQLLTNADNTFIALKRLIGRRFDEPEVQSRGGQGLFESPQGDIRVRHHDRVYALAELNALILTELRAAAEAYLGEAVTKAVITVPAYFNDGQRQATRDAGTIAGLDVVRMINEPTAAAVAYGYGRGFDKKVVVYDLGGGTFDISIVGCKPDGGFAVLGTGGDTLLGGEDFDRLIAEWLVERFKREHGIDPPNDHGTRLRFKQAAEDAKRELSVREMVEIDVPHIVVHPEKGPLHLRCTLTRHVFDHKTKKLVARTIELTKQALDEAKCSIAEVDDLLLVGGSSRIPAIHQAVTAFLGKKPSQRVHPDEAVALGAALVAYGQGGTGFAESDLPPVHLQDRTPYTLGVRLRGNRREAIIPKNTTLPTRVRRNFSTTREGQTFVDVVVLQGESEVADECMLLADFRLDDIKPGPPGGVSIDLTLAVDESGVVSVTAIDVATQRAQTITVLASTALSADDVARMRRGLLEQRPGAIAEPVAPVATQALFPDEPPSGHMPIHIGAAVMPSHVPAPSISIVPTSVTQPLPPRQTLGSGVTQPIARQDTSTTQPIQPLIRDSLLRESRIPRVDPRSDEAEVEGSPRSMPRVDMLSNTPRVGSIAPRIEMKPEPAALTVPPTSGAATVPSPPAALATDLPPASALVSGSVAPASRRSSKPAGFRLQLKALIATCDASAKSAAVALASSDFALATVDEAQKALTRARLALDGEDEAAMRECAFELANVEQTLTTLLA